MRLIDADAIDFSEIKDDFDRARAKIIIMGYPTINQGCFWFSNRLVLAKCFEEWAKENNVLNCAQNVISWLHSMGFIYIDKANEYANQNKHKHT
ncbi:MAG: hypothetical protein J6S23_02420 [Clostridia bacterium]|nr:hypothetical protein [Clostridia bacterium]